MSARRLRTGKQKQIARGVEASPNRVPQSAAQKLGMVDADGNTSVPGEAVRSTVRVENRTLPYDHEKPTAHAVNRSGYAARLPHGEWPGGMRPMATGDPMLGLPTSSAAYYAMAGGPFLAHDSAPEVPLQPREAIVQLLGGFAPASEISDDKITADQMVEMARRGVWLYGMLPDTPNTMVLTAKWNAEEALAYGFIEMSEPDVARQVLEWRRQGFGKVRVKILLGSHRWGSRWSSLFGSRLAPLPKLNMGSDAIVHSAVEAARR